MCPLTHTYKRQRCNFHIAKLSTQYIKLGKLKVGKVKLGIEVHHSLFVNRHYNRTFNYMNTYDFSTGHLARSVPKMDRASLMRTCKSEIFNNARTTFLLHFIQTLPWKQLWISSQLASHWAAKYINNQFSPNTM